jgi:hypothetical protein
MVTMSTRTYARIAHGTVVEFFTTAGDIGTLFHRDLRWIEVADVAAVAHGWRFDGERFTPPHPTATEPFEHILPDPTLVFDSPPGKAGTSPPA